MKIIWSPKALKNASEHADYIAEDSPTEAKKWLIRLFKEVKRLVVLHFGDLSTKS